MYCFNLREIFAFTCIHTLRLQNCGFLYETGFLSSFKFSASHLLVFLKCSFVFFVNLLTVNERASVSKAVLEIEVNAVIYRVSQKFVPLFSCTITFDKNFIFT